VAFDLLWCDCVVFIFWRFDCIAFCFVAVCLFYVVFGCGVLWCFRINCVLIAVCSICGCLLVGFWFVAGCVGFCRFDCLCAVWLRFSMFGCCLWRLDCVFVVCLLC